MCQLQHPMLHWEAHMSHQFERLLMVLVGEVVGKEMVWSQHVSSSN